MLKAIIIDGDPIGLNTLKTFLENHTDHIQATSVTEVSNLLEAFSQKKKESTAYGIIKLSVKKGIIFIRPQDIIRLEADRSYTIFHLANDVKHVGSKSLKEYEPLLDPEHFYRCHPSHLINLNKVARLLSHEGLFVEMSDGSTPTLLKKNKQVFLEKLRGT